MAHTKWILDPTHSELGFKIKHLMISNVSGSFKNFQVKAETDGEDFTTARIQAKVQMESIDTANSQRDHHLRTSDFLDVENYPELIFQSSRIEAQDAETFLLHGDLTMKGITQPVTLKVEYSGVTKDPWGGERAGFSVTGKFNRTNWGISFNNVLETGGVALSEDVRLFSELQLVKQSVPEVVA
ncbi:MAG TPA: YceI family protein [Flavisolibacter sp.]|jgi:polyisoprenoid-binding protein YceI|nr:YceI family protein [Flavisolibacter sp.]